MVEARAQRWRASITTLMARRRPDYHPGGFYHIYNRGSRRGPVFQEADNYSYVLRKLKAYGQALDLAVIAYCLLPNHYHLLVRQDGQSAAGLLPQRVFNGYTKAHNRRYGHTGTLFQGPYRALLVDDESYLLLLCRYIHANPVVHGLVAEVGEWPYSNYLEWTGEREGSLVDLDLARAYYPQSGEYGKSVGEYALERRMPDAVRVHILKLERQ